MCVQTRKRTPPWMTQANTNGRKSMLEGVLFTCMMASGWRQVRLVPSMAVIHITHHHKPKEQCNTKSPRFFIPYRSIVPTMSWSSASYSNRTMPTDRPTSSSSSSSSRNGDSIPTLIANSNDRMSMESVSSLSSSHSLLPYSTMTTTLPNNSNPASFMMTSNINSNVRSENPSPAFPRHRSVSMSGAKHANASIPPPSASSLTSMSTPFPPRTLQPIENRMGGPPGQVHAVGAGAPDSFDFLKSPTTLTFERMIEACTYSILQCDAV
jgi:hypothetical protein